MTPGPEAMADAAHPIAGGDVASDVGSRLREARQARRLTLRKVAERAGITEGYLSQIERGRSQASVATLRSVAESLGLHIGDLFAPVWQPEATVLRVSEREALAIGALGRKYRLSRPAPTNLEVFLGDLDPGGSTGEQLYAHGDSEEFVYVVVGEVELLLGEERYGLSTGDCADYRSSTPHTLREVADEPAQVLWVISPPSY